jgi:hypothetical protein
VVEVGGVNIQMSEQGWPLAAQKNQPTQVVSLKSCQDLWLYLLQNPAPIRVMASVSDSVNGSVRDAITRQYQLFVTAAGECRYQFYANNAHQYFFDYSPETGKVVSHSITNGYKK